MGSKSFVLEKGRGCSGDQPEKKNKQDEGQDDLKSKIKSGTCEQDTKGAHGENTKCDLEAGALA